MALRRLGYTEGQKFMIERRFAHGNLDRLPALAAELVKLRVDVILTETTPAALAAKQTTATIPIVMATGGDAVGSGLVASLAHPGRAVGPSAGSDGSVRQCSKSERLREGVRRDGP